MLIHGQVKYEMGDLYGSRLKPALVGRQVHVKDRIIEKFEAPEHAGSVTRITLETHDPCNVTLAAIPNPPEILVQLQQKAARVGRRSWWSASQRSSLSLIHI